jgi:hypothetical protein
MSGNFERLLHVLRQQLDFAKQQIRQAVRKKDGFLD